LSEHGAVVYRLFSHVISADCKKLQKLWIYTAKKAMDNKYILITAYFSLDRNTTTDVV